MSFLAPIEEVSSYRYVLVQLVRQHLRLKYRRTVFGYLWTLINPILTLFVLALVFSSLLKWEFRDFIFLLFAGLVPWNIFSNTVIQSCTTFITNEELIKKIHVPKVLFPLSVSIALLIDGLIYFCTVYPFVLIFGGKLGIGITLLPIAFVLLFVFALGLSLVFSLLTTFFRDFQWLIPVAMQAWFFLTPILYDKDIIFGPLSWFVAINPLTPFIELFKAPLYTGTFPDPSCWFVCTVLAFGVLLMGIVVLTKFQHRIVYRL